MVVAGGEWQVPLIHKAKGMGFFVINTNLYPDSPGFMCSDVGIVSDVLDKETNLECAKQYEVHAVISDQSDIAINTVAYVSQELGLPSIGLKTAELFTNKFKMREFCSQHGFLTPSYALCQSLQDVLDFSQKNDYPFVIKPPANQSSRGVSKVSKPEELQSAYELALQNSRDQTVLVEGFIDGQELTVDGIKLNNGDHYCLATSIKRPCKDNLMVANRLWFSNFNSEINYHSLHEIHNDLISKMQLTFGLTHAEYKHKDGKFYLIEVAARGGGTRLSSDIVPLMSGIDTNKLLISMALGEKVSNLEPIFSKKECALDFFEFEPGLVSTIKGVDQIESMEGILGFGLNIREGDTIHPASDDRSRHGYVIAHSDNKQSLTSLLKKIRQTIKITYELHTHI